MPAMLPAIDLFDGAFERSGWQWQDGICELIPSRSSLADAEDRFGPPCAVSELANGYTYDFLNGAVRVTLLNGSSEIWKIIVNKRPETESFIAPDVVSAMTRYGKLSATRLDRAEGVTFERPGMRVICDPGNSPEEVLRIEVFRPCQDFSP